LEPTSRHPNIQLLVQAWREVGRHLELEEFVEAIAPPLAALLPFARLRIARIDRTRARIEIAASAPPAVVGGAEGPAFVPLGPGALDVIDRWAAARASRSYAPDARDRVRASLGAVDRGGWLVLGPLLRDGELLGLLLVEPKGDPGVEGLRLIDELLDPFSGAVANDTRLAELARLREAAEAENRALRTRLARQDIRETVVGATSGLRTVMERVEQVARTDAPVLVLGETGSGKEVVAREIHARSARANGPFLRVNCGAIPAELVDSELFGHEKGSFTGAVSMRLGWFERADGGTLFLDEVAELPPAAQVRLLRVLQDGTFERVGGERSLHADVRLVAATHREVQSLVAQQQFREDLWYRISVFPIRLPPLRERKQDIPALARHFASSAGQRLHGTVLVPSATDLELLAAWDWPGNVRELAAVIERAAILGNGEGLDVATALGPPPLPGSAADGSLEDVSRRTIEAALDRAHGRIEGPTGAARVLGVNPSTLRSKMQRLGIEWSRFRG